LHPVATQDQHGQFGEIIAGEHVELPAFEHFAHGGQPVTVEPGTVADPDDVRIIGQSTHQRLRLLPLRAGKRARAGRVRVQHHRRPEKNQARVLVKSTGSCRTASTRGDQAQWVAVSTDVAVVLLFTLAGFLIGGAYSTWKTTRPLAISLAVAAVLAAAGAVLWLL